MGWLFWMFVMWFVFTRLARRRRRWGRMGAGPGLWWMAVQCPPGHVRLGHHRVGMAPPAPAPLSPVERRDRAMADLRRRYVADEISVEEYEAGLDRLLRDS